MVGGAGSKGRAQVRLDEEFGAEWIDAKNEDWFENLGDLELLQMSSRLTQLCRRAEGSKPFTYSEDPGCRNFAPGFRDKRKIVNRMTVNPGVLRYEPINVTVKLLPASHFFHQLLVVLICFETFPSDSRLQFIRERVESHSR